MCSCPTIDIYIYIGLLTHCQNEMKCNKNHAIRKLMKTLYSVSPLLRPMMALLGKYSLAKINRLPNNDNPNSIVDLYLIYLFFSKSEIVLPAK